MMEIEKVKEITVVETESDKLARERLSIRKRIHARKERYRVASLQKEIVECPECGGHSLESNQSRGEIVCRECGLVLEEVMIDPGPEWRAFDSDQKEKRARTGAPSTVLIHDKGLSTMIDWRNRDGYGKALNQENREKYHRLRKWQRRIRVQNAKERNLAFALGEMDRMASALGLPRNVREVAATIYRKALEKNIIRGHSIEGMVSASLYAACRQLGLSRTLDEIGESSRVSRKEIGNNYKDLASELGIRRLPSSPTEYIPRICSMLGLPEFVVQEAMKDFERIKTAGLDSGKSPPGIAATLIYKVTKGTKYSYGVNQKMIAAAADVTEVTIRNNLKIFYPEEYAPET